MPAATKGTQKPVKGSAKGKGSTGFTGGEKAAMKSRVLELKGKGDGEGAVQVAIAKMPAPYRAMGERLHAVIKASAPELSPKTWYGLPAYAKDGKVVCYLRMNPKSPYSDRYMTFGFSETATLDEGAMWPTVFAITKLGAAEEAKVGALVKKAVG